MLKIVMMGLFLVVGREQAGPVSSQRHPWELTATERIAERVRFIHDSANRAPGVISSQSASMRPSASSSVDVVYRYTIDGRRDPQLLMPFELLDVLLEGLSADVSIRSTARAALAPGIRGAGYHEEEFWKRLDALSAEYRRATSTREDARAVPIQADDGGVATIVVDPSRCAARVTLLNATSAAFGAEALSRFLYNVVAPQVRRSITTMQRHQAEELRYLASGCRS